MLTKKWKGYSYILIFTCAYKWWMTIVKNMGKIKYMMGSITDKNLKNGKFELWCAGLWVQENEMMNH